MSLQTMTVDGVDLHERFGVYIDTSLIFNKPKKDVEVISIPGRDSALIVDYGTFQNFVLTVPCFMKDDNALDFADRYTLLIDFLGSIRNYVRIRFSNEPAHFRIGYPIMGQAPTIKRLNREGRFDLSFNCRPFRYLRNGEQAIAIDESPKEIINPTEFDALPFIDIYGYGRLEIISGSVGGAQIEIAQHPSGFIRINSENMTITGNLPYPYKASDYVTIITGGYPRLLPGENTIITDSTIFSSTNSAIYPRWREL